MERVRSLKTVRHSQAVQALIRMLQRGPEKVRNAAAWTLEGWFDLLDAEWSTQDEAPDDISPSSMTKEEGLALFLEATQALAASLREDPQQEVRSVAAIVLGRFSDIYLRQYKGDADPTAEAKALETVHQAMLGLVGSLQCDAETPVRRVAAMVFRSWMSDIFEQYDPIPGNAIPFIDRAVQGLIVTMHREPEPDVRGMVDGIVRIVLSNGVRCDLDTRDESGELWGLEMLGRVVPKWSVVLQRDADEAVRCSAGETLGAWISDLSISYCSSTDVKIQTASSRILQEIVQALTAALHQDRSEAVRAELLRVLRTKWAEVLQADNEQDARVLHTDVLSALREATQGVIRVIHEDRNPQIRSSSARTLGALSSSMMSYCGVREDDATHRETLALSEEVAEALIAVLQEDAVPAVRKEAIGTLEVQVSDVAEYCDTVNDAARKNRGGAVLRQSAYAVMVAVQEEPEVEVRQIALTLLGSALSEALKYGRQTGGLEHELLTMREETLALLMRTAKESPDAENRRRAVRSAGALWDANSEHTSITADLADLLFTDEAVGDAVLQAFWQIGLETILNDEHFDETLRRYTGLGTDVFKENALRCDDYLSDNLFSVDLRRMGALHRTFGAGTIQKMHEEYGISFFGRLTEEVLDHLYVNIRKEGPLEAEGRLLDRPLAVVSLARNDWSAALYPFARHVQELLEQGYDVRAVEPDHDLEFVEQIRRMHDHYGKIDLLVIAGHGAPVHIRLKRIAASGSEQKTIAQMLPQEIPESEYIDLTDDALLQTIEPCLGDAPDIALNSCLTGYEGDFQNKWHHYYVDESIARRLSRILDARVFTPDGPAGFEAFFIGKDGDGRPVLEGIGYLHSRTLIFDRGRKIVPGGVRARYAFAHGGAAERRVPPDEKIRGTTVGLDDFLLLVARFGVSSGEKGFEKQYDLDDDGVVGLNDVLVLIARFGKAAARGGRKQIAGSRE